MTRFPQPLGINAGFVWASRMGLGFNAEGEMGFIAKATVGVEATVTLTFERATTS